jgi:1,4-alpha-glucan branching enzyme
MNKTIAHSLLTDFDISLFQSGKHFRLYEKLGSHLIKKGTQKGCYFAVYAPAANRVSVAGDFNHWDGEKNSLFPRTDGSGIWEGFIPGIKKGDIYKYFISSDLSNVTLEKCDPYAKYAEKPPRSGSVVWDLSYTWNDNKWVESREKYNSHDAAISVYEVHLASWRWNVEEDRPLSYAELAIELTAYVKQMGFTHVELLPVMEFPFDGSWGYQVLGYFAPTSRFGTPEEFMSLVDHLHEENIGVILDWVPAHFPADGHGLANFDGSHVYEHPDRRKGYHPDWQSMIFNFERNEVRSFLISSALFWMDVYHADGLRVDAVASMIHLDYSREEGEWEPNEFGGNIYLAAESLVKELNVAAYQDFPGIQMIAEESTSFPKVSRPVHEGGLGFGMKWMMGWMNDTLEYFSMDPYFRKFHHGKMSFSIFYAFSENFMLPLSHDEVVHGKSSMIGKMPGDVWQKFSNLRLLYCYMFTHPGTKLLFMGNEIAQWNEWNFALSLDWHLLEHDPHLGIQSLIKDLNGLYRSEKALHVGQFSPACFEWIDYSDYNNTTLSYIRKSEDEYVVVVLNFTPIHREKYLVGVPFSGNYKLLVHSDDKAYDGKTKVTKRNFRSKKKSSLYREDSIELELVPLSAMIFKYEKPIRKKGKLKNKKS